ncbi:uracil-DNA glycosylase family protein [Shewanella sp. JM162201]|uniref:Uracil-DNA glycosylase family protein n=1 Tax=Shewanella jiangmenensis TaxID=2837387 RepID=A0ABS5V0C6_9GAMM|nr:uracil-DNA glycosylase family protein [Shewanella jiangmenensis]MBT1443222.1 uracil-DNA glycosylase family protein [Shewanella jiangmenensis]
MTSLGALLDEIRSCTLCSDLPLGPKPILQASSKAKILIAGQAPGAKTHAKGLPFDDASGERLRDWLGVSRHTFYDPECFAIAPMGFCYPGTMTKNGKRSADLPPRPECASAWRARLLSQLPNIKLTLVLGRHALDWHLPGHPGLTASINHWQQHWPALMVLPHPSPRNNLWLAQHPEFTAEHLPRLKQAVADLLG